MATEQLRFFERLKRTLFGKPIPTSQAHHERLGPFIGLPVFSSDALSSVAYATEAVLGVLVLYSLSSVYYQMYITVGICILIGIVVISYQQTIRAYPTGGGSYIVASENLGETPGLIAGAALLVDYILTVAVSVAAGIAALVSAYPHLHELLVPLSVLVIVFIAWANLRGVRESGAVFAVPTYGFILGMLVLILVGVFHVFTSPPVKQLVVADHVGKDLHFLFLFVILRAFAAGCTALTGIEAVSNGVQAFKAPEAKNAIKTLVAMAGLLLVMFIGTGFLAQHIPVLTAYDSSNPLYRTTVSQIAATVFGANSFGFYYVQFFTTLILVLAANTAFADFPRLSSLLARDGYLPRPLARQGDRLVFHNGIIVLAIAAILLVWHFHGQVDLLLPLYAVGVFTAFTLSQYGMVVHWRKLRTPGWKKSATVNFVGTVVTGIVAAVILITKAAEGAWIVVVLLAILYVGFRAVKGRYTAMSKQLALTDSTRPHYARSHKAILLMPRVHRGILKALDYARSIDPNCEAVHITIDERRLPTVQREWQRYAEGVPLVVLNSPHRSLIAPVLDYVDQLMTADPEQMLTVVVAEAVSTRWYHRLLQENVAAQLKHSLERRRNVAVTSVRYFLD